MTPDREGQSLGKDDAGTFYLLPAPFCLPRSGGMSGWSCPHQIGENCTRLKCECRPGRPGCVLRGKVVFASEDDASPTDRKEAKLFDHAPGASRKKAIGRKRKRQ